MHVVFVKASGKISISERKDAMFAIIFLWDGDI